MSTSVRVAGFLLGLAAIFAVALGVGKVAGPTPEEVAPASHSASHDAAHTDGAGDEAGHGGHGRPAAQEVPGGLQVSQDGYTLHLVQPSASAGRSTLSFHVLDPAGRPVTAYDVQHEKRLHLIAVRRDLTGFQHVHPTLADDGTWSVPLDLTAGTWRIFADFKPSDGDPLTLGADLQVDGAVRAAPPPADRRTDTVDGYTVSLEGDIAAGADAELTTTVTRDGKQVDLQPYLGAEGHLVALREGDLAYLHVHPEGSVFHTSLPSPGRYRFFLDFKHDGVVRTAEFTVDTDAGSTDTGRHGHDH